MIVRTNSAKDYYCPFKQSACVGDTCMMWREIEKASKPKIERIKTPLIGEEVKKAEYLGFKKIKEDYDYIYWERETGDESRGTGYCGLAGTPLELRANNIPEQAPVRRQNVHSVSQNISENHGQTASPQNSDMDLDINILSKISDY